MKNYGLGSNELYQLILWSLITDFLVVSSNNIHNVMKINYCARKFSFQLRLILSLIIQSVKAIKNHVIPWNSKSFKNLNYFKMSWLVEFTQFFVWRSKGQNY